MTTVRLALDLLAVVIVATCSAAVAAVPGAGAGEGARPNIILIMADDMGFSDLGCYGGEINTPNIDRLGKNGLRFTQFYNTARCCPTRAALLTGLYPHQAGIGHMVDAWSQRYGEGYAGDLNDRCVTIAQVLKSAGYGTYMTGKWHVSPKIAPESPADKANWPRQRGFDRFYGTIHGAGSFYDPNTLTRDNTFISPFADPEYKPERFYYTDAISDHAVRFIKEHARDQANKPLFMYVPYTSPHWPMHAPEEDIAKYRGKYSEGYDAIRQRRIARMKQMGLLDPKWEPNPTVGDWAEVADKQWEMRGMEVYAAMVEIMDRGIGRIVAQLEESGQLDNTLIMFLQDNGGCAEGLGRQAQGERADRPTLPPMDAAALQPDMIPKQTRDGWPIVQGRKVLPGPADTYVAYGRDWANVSNTPFREYKHWVHEGGIATPLVVHWPARLKQRAGEWEHTPSHLIDLMATCVDLAEAKYPSEHNGTAITPMQGVSLAPLFGGGKIERPQPIFFEHEGNRAVREGKWKLVAKGPRGKWELYDMEADRTEMHDLAAKQPAKVKELAAKWQVWAERAKVLPWPWDEEAEKAKAKNAKKAK